MKYIDLGLPSGTKWKAENEKGYYEFDEAVKKYGNSLPTLEQFEELKDNCKWEWNGRGYDIIGPNGNSIVLPAEGYRYFDGDVDGLDSDGKYLSSTPNGSDYAWDFRFYSGCVYIEYANRCYVARSVRLIKIKDNDMKNKELNIAEILKDCPEGTPLYSPIFGNVTFHSINHHNDIYPIIVNVSYYTRMFAKDGRYDNGSDGECMLFPSKDNRDWDTFNVRQNFKKGDFVTRVYDNGEHSILLMGETDWSSKNNPVGFICYLDLSNDSFTVSDSLDYWCAIDDFYEEDRYRLATADEKKKLLDAIGKHGYVWDEEKLELRKKDKKTKFKKGDFIVDLCGDNRTIMILEDDVDLDGYGNVNVACSCDIDDVYRNLCLNKIWCTVSELGKRVRYATEDEILILLYIIDKHGYVWDEEKLELCEKEHEFKPFDRVLVREEYGTQWFATLFSHIDESHHGYKYGCCTGDYWKYCIPYEGNEDLLGTANNPKNKIPR